MKVKEVMTTDVVTVGPETPVRELARLMLEKNIGGIPVVEDNRLVGIVTEEDLIVKNVKIKFPTYIQLLDAVIYLESIKKYEEELRKALGATAGEVMTSPVITISPDEDIEAAATLMFEKGISRLPVVEDDRLVGIVTKRDIIKTLASEKS